MQLGISSDAAPGASIADLFAACEKRGLYRVELSLAADTDLAALVREIHDAGDTTVRISGIVAGPNLYAHQLASLSRQLSAPVIVAIPDSLDDRITFACSILAHGGNALPLMHGPASDWLRTVATARTRFAWQVDETSMDPASDAKAILAHSGTVEYVRIIGGGPETAMQEGRGIGALMQCLALSSSTGSLILVPSSNSYRMAWAAWLGRRSGWGCGSKADLTARNTIPIHQ